MTRQAGNSATRMLVRARALTIAFVAVAGLIAAGAGGASAATGGGSAAAAGGTAAPAAASATAGTDHFLHGDSCPTATFCMAVGAYHLSGHQPGLSEVRSAGKWTVKPVPSPAHGSNVFANEVSCSSATSCLFVGQHWAGSNGADAALAEAWNGSKWRIIAATSPAGTTESGLNDVACPTSNFCLVVGDAGTSATRYHSTAYTWSHGASWKEISVPGPSGSRSSELGGLACSDAAHCMAVGNYTSSTGHYLPFADHWTSGHWKVITLPAIAKQSQVIPEGISCQTANECVEVGITLDNTKQHYYHAYAELWSGGKWHLMTLRGAPSQFDSVSCPAAGRCFASGYTWPSLTGYAHQLIETWNGHAWDLQQPAEAAGVAGTLTHVSCVSATSCESVGFSFSTKANSDAAISEGWNGSHWLGQKTLNP
jgi:hypothetical protein